MLSVVEIFARGRGARNPHYAGGAVRTKSSPFV
jgi:hypothetical protein